MSIKHGSRRKHNIIPQNDCAKPTAITYLASGDTFLGHHQMPPRPDSRPCSRPLDQVSCWTAWRMILPSNSMAEPSFRKRQKRKRGIWNQRKISPQFRQHTTETNDQDANPRQGDAKVVVFCSMAIFQLYFDRSMSRKCIDVLFAMVTCKWCCIIPTYV